MKIFLSPTYEDLKEHRRAVRDSILRLGHHPICMKDFGSRPTEPKVAALDEVAKCGKLQNATRHCGSRENCGSDPGCDLPWLLTREDSAEPAKYQSPYQPGRQSACG